MGDIYDGEWIRDKANGFGTYTSFNSGGSYTGYWENDLQHGKGIEKWQDDSYYEGEFLYGEKSGLGR